MSKRSQMNPPNNQTMQIVSVNPLPPSGGWEDGDPIEVQVTAVNENSEEASDTFEVVVDDKVTRMVTLTAGPNTTITESVDTSARFDKNKYQTVEIADASVSINPETTLESATKEIREGVVTIEATFNGPVDGLSYAGSWDPALPSEPTNITRSQADETAEKLGALSGTSALFVPIGSAEAGTVTVKFTLPRDNRDHTFEHSALVWSANGKRHAYNLLNNTIESVDRDN